VIDVSDEPDSPPSDEVDRPLGAYAFLMGTFLALVGGFAAWVRNSGRELPAGPSPADLALVTVAAHKASRLLSKERVTSPVRAPFTEVEPADGAGKLEETATGDGLRRALGELVGCPRCLSLWLVTAFMAGLIVAPRTTRWIASGLAAVFGSDLLQVANRRIQASGDQRGR
jgi:hypothetical protein